MIKLIRRFRTKRFIRRFQCLVGKGGPPGISTGWEAWKLDEERLAAARRAVAAFEQRQTLEGVPLRGVTMTDRIVIDWDEIDSRGLPRSPITYLFPDPPSTFMAQVVGLYLRDRERVRRTLVDAVVRQMSLGGGRMQVMHQFDGGEHPHLLATKITTSERNAP